MNVQPITDAEQAFLDGLSDEQKRDLMAKACLGCQLALAKASTKWMQAFALIERLLPYAEAAQSPSPEPDVEKESVLLAAYAFVKIAPPTGAQGK